MLSPRQQLIFEAFTDAPELPKSVSDFSFLGIERTTVFRDLKGLVNAGLVSMDGKAYRLKPNATAYVRWDLSRPPHQRHPVRYNAKLLDDYQPNVTTLLSATQIAALEAAGAVASMDVQHEDGKAYERILASLLIDLTHASSNLENVAISWLDTKTLIEFGERPEGLSEKQMRVVLNHKEAIAFLKQHRARLSMRKRDLLDIHSLLLRGLLADPSAVGALRSVIVKFEDSRYTPPDHPQQLGEIFEQFCEKAAAVHNPYEQAFLAMIFLPYIQPFQDGNKRCSRLAMNIPLVKNGLAPFSFSDMRKRDYMFGLLAFYERGRHDFLAESFCAAYQKSALRYGELIRYVNDGGYLNTVSPTETTST